MNLENEFTNHLKSQKKQLSEKTIKNYKADVRLFLRWYETSFNQNLKSNQFFLNFETIQAYRKDKILTGLASRSLKRHFSSLRKFFKFLKTERVIQEDPFEARFLSKAKSRQADKWHLQKFKNFLSLNNKSRLTIKNYIFDIQRFLIWGQESLGENVLEKINRTVFDDYKKSLTKKGLSPRTIKRNFSSLQQYLNWLNREADLGSLNLKIQNSDFIKYPSKEESLLPKPKKEEDKRSLAQKLIRGITFILEIIIAPIVKTAELFEDSISRIQGKPIFKEIPSVSHELKIRNISFKKEKDYKDQTQNLPKGLYNDLSLYLEPLPWHKKFFHNLRLSLLILSVSILGFAIYENITAAKQKSILSSFTSYRGRVLSFKGELTDEFGNPITQVNTPLKVAIYNNQIGSGSAMIWEELISVNPDKNGRFSALIGTHTPIPPEILSEDIPLWLGMTIGNSNELIPRQQLYNVYLAKDSEKLHGMSTITSNNSDTKNVILALDSSGNLSIGGNANPTFQATGGRFKLLGEILLLSTTPGTDSNIEIAPMDLGKIDLQKPIFNRTENNNVYQSIGSVEIDDSLSVLATTSAAQSAFTIIQDSTGNLISSHTNGIEKFSINNNGDIISENGTKWKPFSDSTSALNIANAAGNSFITFDTKDSKLRFLYDSKERSELFYDNSDSTFNIRSTSSLALSADNSSSTRLLIATSGNIGLGTENPNFRLDVQDSKESSAAAHIFNTNSSTDADGLIIKLGNTSTTVDANNRFLSLETSGIGIIGSIRGDGNTGVEFKTEGIADFAEYIKKDKNESIEYGSIICIDEKGLVLPCDSKFQKIIGVSSNQGGFTGGKDQGDESIRVGFVGQVYTRVSTANGPIKPGDPLTSSSIPGIAVKATDKGQIIGTALEGISENSENSGNQNVSGSDNLMVRNSDFSGSPSNSESFRTAKILVSVNISWYDPNAFEKAELAKEESLKEWVFAILNEFTKSSEIISPIANKQKVDQSIVSPLPITAKPTTINLNNISEDQASISAVISPDLDRDKASTIAGQLSIGPQSGGLKLNYNRLR